MQFSEEVLKVAKETRELKLGPPGAAVLPITKVSGAPWWPRGVARPQCTGGHRMSFMLQVRLDDVPGLSETSSALASFHYCQQCSYEGKMSWGWDAGGGDSGYDVRVFRRTDGVDVDGLGVTGELVLPAHSVILRPVLEVPALEDLPFAWEELPKDYPAGKDDFDEDIYPGLKHISRSKVGGWPTWVQTPRWPDQDPQGWRFLAQLDWALGERAPWAAGGYAYLFLPADGDLAQGELVLQTT